MVALNPNHFWATNELTLLLLARGALVEAEVHARNAIRIAPQNAQAHNLMGLVLTEANRPLVGEYHYRRVLELAEGEEPITLANLAWNLKNQGRIEEARALYQRSMALKPGVVQTILGYAKMEEADRKFPRALELLDEAEQLIPGTPSMQLTRATVLSRLKRNEEALAILQPAGRRRGASRSFRAFGERAGCSIRWAGMTRPSPVSSWARQARWTWAGGPIWPRRRRIWRRG